MSETTQNLKAPLPGMTVTPEFYGTQEWEILLGGFWCSLCNHLIGQPEARKAFKEDTGLNIEGLIPRSPIDALIDGATGHRETVLAAWCDWVTRNHWGEAEKGTDS